MPKEKFAKKSGEKILVGLGNPSREYADTYHNAGIMALTEVSPALAHGEFVPDARAYKDLFEYAETGDFVLVRPLVFMNESGRAVREALKVFGAKPENLIVFHDDSDITIGNFKVSFARNSAGHKGVQSIIDTLHTNKFFRIRIGVRPAREARRQKAGEFALKTVTPKDRATLKTVFKKITELLPAIVAPSTAKGRAQTSLKKKN